MNSCLPIELRNVSKSFGGRVVTRDVSFRLFAGESVSICGVSGVGKTTLLNIASLLEYPDSGDVFWDGEMVSKKCRIDVCRMRGRMFGFIFQDHNLIHELSVMGNVLLPVRVHSRVKKSDVDFANSLLKTLGMGSRHCSSIDVLSAGERQRVALARALIGRPKVILADEPTGNLDEINAYDALTLMLDMCKQNGSSLLFITHNQKLAALTDRKFLCSTSGIAQQEP
jgi:ABC-type lipoprotein export system ATPase subunit